MRVLSLSLSLPPGSLFYLCSFARRRLWPECGRRRLRASWCLTQSGFFRLLERTHCAAAAACAFFSRHSHGMWGAIDGDVAVACYCACSSKEWFAIAQSHSQHTLSIHARIPMLTSCFLSLELVVLVFVVVVVAVFVLSSRAKREKQADKVDK